jgi:hypothetical protein
MSFSDYLFARRRGFLRGMASVLQLGGGAPLYNYTATPDQSDTLAAYSDWRTIGHDMRRALAHAKKRVRTYQPSLFE